MRVTVMKTDARAKLPTYGSEEAAGADLYALLPNESVKIAAGKTEMIHTGIAMEIPTGYVGLVCARSGLASKRGLAPANKVGVIDSDYRGEIIVALHNHSASECEIAQGERVAQLVIVPYLSAELVETDVLSSTERGAGGFGSTGKK